MNWDDKIVNRLQEKLLLDKAQPNGSLVSEVLSLDARKVPEVSTEDLDRYIVVLGQYMITLRYNSNVKSARYAFLHKTFEHKILLSALHEEFPKEIKTEKAKKAYLIASDPDLAIMYEDLLVVEVEKTLLSGMDSAVESLLNGLKKEKSSRIVRPDLEY